ncbi:MAG: DUF4147 domain-containing protein [Thermoplasmata archaeon]|nr:DUF4147 domain-containing protein [Thermoplasmata archaeon]
MAARFPGEPFSPDRMPDPNAPTDGTDPIFSTIYQAAVTGADAYRATRTAVRRADDSLRIGNRFVRIGRYREIAFVALGGAAISQALAVSAALGDALTQGFVVAPDPLPPEVPFRSRKLPTGWPGAPGIADEVLELAQGLGERDLLLLLLSPGALGYLAAPPERLPPEEWTAMLQRLAQAGARSRELALIARVLGAGGVGGRVAAATTADLVPLVVDRGDGADLVGGGPTRPVQRDERVAARSVLERLGAIATLPTAVRVGLDPGASAPAPAAGNRAGGVRPVAVTAPADALREVGEAVAEKRWKPILAELNLDEPPEAAADRLVRRAEEIRVGSVGEPVDRARPSRGTIAFAATTLSVLEGVDDRPAMVRFLRRVAAELPRRDVTVGVLRTVGASDDSAAPGGVVGASRTGAKGASSAVRPLRMRAGITDVGDLAAIVIPAS